MPPNHPDSNYGMSRRALLDLVPIQPDSVYRMEADDADLDAAADRYAQLLPQHFDLMLLGLGTDGHTASLFPGDEACDEQERRAVPATAPNGSRRLTLSFPTLNAARHVIFLVLGADKRDALRTDPRRRAAAGRPRGARPRRRDVDRRRRGVRRRLTVPARDGPILRPCGR